MYLIFLQILSQILFLQILSHPWPPVILSPILNTVHFAGNSISWKLLPVNTAGTSLKKLTEESWRSQGAGRKGWVRWLWNRAANSEPAGRLHPCKKNRDAELASCDEGEEWDPLFLFSDMVLIGK